MYRRISLFIPEAHRACGTGMVTLHKCSNTLVQAKNTALKEAGAIVPDSFEALEGAVKQTYDKLVAEGILVPQPDVPAPSVPLDLEAAKKAGKARPLHPDSDIQEA